jgi:hypothetical protein
MTKFHSSWKPHNWVSVHGAVLRVSGCPLDSALHSVSQTQFPRPIHCPESKDFTLTNLTSYAYFPCLVNGAMESSSSLQSWLMFHWLSLPPCVPTAPPPQMSSLVSPQVRSPGDCPTHTSIPQVHSPWWILDSHSYFMKQEDTVKRLSGQCGSWFSQPLPLKNNF